MSASRLLVPPPPPLPPRRLWFGILGAPAAWAVQGLLAWFLETHACGKAWPGAVQAPPGAARAAVLIVSAIAIVVAVVALVIGTRRWRDSRDRGLTGMRAQTRPDFIGAIAMLVSFSFLVAILLTAFAAVVLRACETLR